MEAGATPKMHAFSIARQFLYAHARASCFSMLDAQISHHDLLERYGMTETGMILSNPLHTHRLPGIPTYLFLTDIHPKHAQFSPNLLDQPHFLTLFALLRLCRVCGPASAWRADQGCPR